MTRDWGGLIAASKLARVMAAVFITTLASCSGGDSGGGILAGVSSGQSSVSVQSEPAVEFNADSYLLVTNDEDLFRVSAATGVSELLHEFPLGIGFLDPVDVVGNQVIATAEDNTINGIDATTGAFLWEYSLGRSAIGDDASTPFCIAPICYAIGSGDEISALDVVSQSDVWHFDLRTIASDAVDEIGPSMSVAGDHVYIAGNFSDIDGSTLIVFDRHTGTLLERIDLSAYRISKPKAVGSTLLIPTYRSLLAYDINTWELLWSTGLYGGTDSLSGLYRAGQLAVAGNVVTFSSFAETTGDQDFDKRVLVGVDIDTGSIIWTVDAGEIDGLRFDPQSDGTTFYTAFTEYQSTLGYRGKKGYPMAIDPQTGSVLWKLERLHVDYEPLAAAGHLFFHDIFFSGQGGYYSGFGGLNMRNGEVLMTAPAVRSVYSSVPTLVHNNDVYVARRCNLIRN